MNKITLSATTLLDLSISDFVQYSRLIPEEQLWELFFDAQKARDLLVNVDKYSYLIDPLKKEWHIYDSRPEQTDEAA